MTKFDLREAQFRKPVLMYHGTTDAVLRSILKQGVIPFPKKRAWAKDDDIGHSTMSRVSVGGSYWTTNMMTAKSSAHHARNVLGGKNRVIVIANIQQQSAFSDEDNVNYPIKYGFAEVARQTYRVNELWVCAPIFFTDYDLDLREKAITIFIDTFMQYIGREREQKYVLPRDKAEEILRVGILREIAHQGDNYYTRSALSRYGLPEDFPIPDRKEIEAEFLKLRADLSRTYKLDVYKTETSFDNRLRIEDVVGYSGANKIVAVIEVVEYHELARRDEERFILHYGAIPEDFREQWRKGIGQMRDVYDPKGNLIEKGDKAMAAESVLTEGLIKLPPKMIEEIMFYVKFNTLWWARDRLKGKSKTMPDVVAAWKEEVRKFGEEIPKEPYRPTKNFFFTTIPVSTAGMGPEYEKLTPKKSSIGFAIRWFENETTHGFWWGEKNALVLNPLSYDYMKRFGTGHTHPDDLKIFFTDLQSTIEHELRHCVQELILQDDRQLKRKAKYTDYGRDYYTSPIEFDPTIGSAAHDFIRMWDTGMELGRPLNLSKAIRRYVGIEKTMPFDQFAANSFFAALRKDAPKRYKKAIVKFTQEVKALIKAKKPVTEGLIRLGEHRSQSVFENPSRSQLAGLLDNARYKLLRGLVANGSVYVWDANLMTHAGVERMLRDNGYSTNRTTSLLISNDHRTLIMNRDWYGEPSYQSGGFFFMVSPSQHIADFAEGRLATLFADPVKVGEGEGVG